VYYFATKPYRSLTQTVMAVWRQWLAPRLAGDDGDTEALATMAVIDGLLFLRHAAGPEAAATAARVLGVSP
jgi:hypothetical protein